MYLQFPHVCGGVSSSYSYCSSSHSTVSYERLAEQLHLIVLIIGRSRFITFFPLFCFHSKIYTTFEFTQ
jgi:hypothetical protein